MFDLLMIWLFGPMLWFMKCTYLLLKGIKWLIETPVKAFLNSKGL